MTSKTRGITLILISAFFLTLTSTIVKYLDYPVYEKVFFRNAISVILISMLIKPNMLIVKGNDIKLLLYRLILGLAGMLTFYYSIDRMVLSDVEILHKLSVFFIVIFASLFLGEKLRKLQVYAIVIAFTGAMFVIKPSFDSAMNVSLIAVTSAAFIGGAYTLLRRIKHIDAYVIVFYFALFNALITFMLGYRDFVLPQGLDLLLFLVMGITATIGQVTITTAYKYAPASEISIYNYSSIIFAVVFSIFVFNTIPDLYSILGAFLIVIAAFLQRYSLLNSN